MHTSVLVWSSAYMWHTCDKWLFLGSMYRSLSSTSVFISTPTAKSITCICPFGMTRMFIAQVQFVSAGAKSGRLESLSGGSKQSQSTSSKLRLTADSSNQPASSSHLQHVDSDADSHARQADKLSNADFKHASSIERQRTSDLSSRDILDTADDGKIKDEMESQNVAIVRCDQGNILMLSVCLCCTHVRSSSI